MMTVDVENPEEMRQIDTNTVLQTRKYDANQRDLPSNN